MWSVLIVEQPCNLQRTLDQRCFIFRAKESKLKYQLFKGNSGFERSNCQHSMDHREKREFQKNIYFCITDYMKAFDCVNHNKLWKILQEMGIPHHLTCLLRNLYAGQEATVRTGHVTTFWFQFGKGVCQVCLLSP